MTLPLSRLFLAAVAVTALAGPAYAGPTSPDVPGKITPPAGNKVFLVAHAEGVQIYHCDTTASAWLLDGPAAQLYSESGKFIGTHYTGPTWQALDGSYVTATKVDGVNVDPAAVDWLLLAKKSSAAGAEGNRLTATTYIQRINTTGGRAPAASECDVTGETAAIDYTADYYFWKKS